jgi:hypothetical protein
MIIGCTQDKENPSDYQIYSVFSFALNLHSPIYLSQDIVQHNQE